MTARPLSEATLRHHAARVAVPNYDRSALGQSVVHISVGCFHRSHQAVFFDDLARTGETGWGLVGVGLRRRALQEVLAAQDRLYTVVERGAERDSARIVGALTRYLFGPDDPSAVVDALASPQTRLVTLTITAGGYKLERTTGGFAVDDAEVSADLATPGNPRSALGYVVEALDRRRRAGTAPFTVISCDNMPANGEVARLAVTAHAALRDPALARWIEREVAFPSCMVDRITPQTTPEDVELVERAFGVADHWPIVTEPFSDWVIEDSFCNARPPLDTVGVRYVDDVAPYALTKTRLLNASHCALGYLGYLSGHRRTDEAMADPVFGEYAARLMHDEVRPLLPTVGGVDLGDYIATLLERLRNPKIGDRLARLGRGGTTKVPCHLLSSIVEARRVGRDHSLLTLAVAGWCRYLRGVDERGQRYDIDDPLAGRVVALALAGRTDPRPLLSERSVFGELGADEGFASELEAALRAIEREGTRGAVAACLMGAACRAA